MPRLIQDEFTMLPVSAQRKHQLRHERDGKCRVCPQPATHGPYCEKHRKKQMDLQRNWKRSKADPSSII